MLQVDYKISRNEGEGNDRSFFPDPILKKIDGNAVYLEAPNAKGKSSLLNILAISMYGHQLDGSDSRISPTLKSNIEYMMQRSDQTFTFEVRFSSNDRSIQLISKKDDSKYSDIVIQEINNGITRTLPFQMFKNEYYLVYDIPENPLNRLKEILTEVEHQQERYRKKISDFKEYLEEIKEQLARSRDENEIQQLQTTIADYEEEIESLNDIIDGINNKIKIIEPFFALREFLNYAKLAASITDSIERGEKKIKTFEKTQKRHNTLYINKRQEVELMINTVVQGITQLSTKLGNIFIESKDMKTYLTHLQKIDYHKFIETYKINPSISKELDHIAVKIDQYKETKEIKEAGRKGEFFKDILKILETYRGIDLFIPGTDKSIEELINIIQSESKKNKEFTDIYATLNECSSIISTIRETITNLPKKLDSLKVAFNKQKEISINSPEPQEIDDEIDKLNKNLTDALYKVEKFVKIAEKYDLDIHNMDEITIQREIQQIVERNNQYLSIFQQDENRISKILEDYYAEISREAQNISSTKDKISQYKQRLSDLEGRDRHKYDAYASEIEEISSIVDSLEFDLIKYKKIINKIQNGEKLNDGLEITYNNKISQYLALKIPEFPYIDDFVRPTMIDFTLRKIYTDDGKEIDMKDISTGQAMSMYIQAILNRPSDDKRKLIVIFDEASTMDSNSFQPIKTTLKRLIKENKLIFALFARAIDGKMKLTEIV